LTKPFPFLRLSPQIPEQIFGWLSLNFQLLKSYSYEQFLGAKEQLGVNRPCPLSFSIFVISVESIQFRGKSPFSDLKVPFDEICKLRNFPNLFFVQEQGSFGASGSV